MPQFKKPLKFHEGLYVKAYELARDGLKGTKLAKGLGTDLQTLKRWKKKYPHFHDAIEKGRSFITGVKTSQFVDYVYGKLPPKLQKVWDTISAWEDEPNAISSLEALLARNGEHARMHLFAHALFTNGFNVSAACRTLNMSFEQMNDMVVNNPDFGVILEQMKLCKKDFYESALVKLVGEGDPSAVIFVNKTFNRDRGYNEKTELEVTGNVTNTHLIDISVLNLPLDVKRMILDAYRKYKENGTVPMEQAPQALEYKRVGNKAVPVDDKEVA